MANAQIYQKTIDPSVQDGVDKCLILDPNAFYQKKFSFNDDWNEIKLGMFLSYTTEANPNATLINELQSGTASPDTFSYIGFIRDNNETKFIPETTSNNTDTFVGMRYNGLAIYKGGSGETYWVDTTTGASWATKTRASIGDSVIYDQNNPQVYTGRTFSTSEERNWNKFGNTTEFCWYLGMRIFQTGTPNQLTFEIRKNPNTTRIINKENMITDITLTNLIQNINTDDLFSSHTLSNITPKPDSFFFYNAHLNARPRIHAIAVKKIS